MNRKTVVIKLKDGNSYKFSERNREDVDYLRYQDKVRAHRINFIQDNIKNTDSQLALIMVEMNKIYSEQDVNMFIVSNKDEIKSLAFDSFKIYNPLISFEQFCELLPDNLEGIIQIISKLEEDELKKKKTDK